MENEENFGFAFNDSDLSDRILRIKIVQEDSPCSGMNKRYFKWLSRSVGVKVKTLPISSPILAAKSPFFYKLFKNGMRESQQRDVTLVVNASEEAALLELLHFIYHKSLRVVSVPKLLDVLMVADKFEVISCMRYCLQLLIKMPMSVNSAVLCLELPSPLLMAEIVRPLIDSAKQYIVEKYKDFTKCQDELMALPLSALEAVLDSDSLQVKSENEVYEFILKWARAHYMNRTERLEILTELLARFINFSYMSCNKLREVAACVDFDGEVSELVIQALCDKVEVPFGQHTHRSNDTVPGRVYIDRLIRVVHLEFPWPHCVVYFDLRRDECANLVSSKCVCSQGFLVGGIKFCLYAHSNEERKFCLFLFKCVSKPCTLGYEFAVMNKSSKEFVSKLKVKSYTLKASDLVGISWDEFIMGEDCEYFIDGIMHLRAEVMIHSIS